jgi:predicted SAM-dependent methyltransferase
MRFLHFILVVLLRCKLLIQSSRLNNLNKREFYVQQIKLYDKHDKLELGGGETPSLKDKGFLNVDIRKLPEVDVVSDVKNLVSHFKHSSICHIYARHFAEHLTKDEFVNFLNDCHKLLVRDGIIELLVPNTLFHLIQFFKYSPGSKGYDHCMAGFNGWQRGQEFGYWDVHKMTFTIEYFKYLFKCDGRYNILFLKTAPKNIHLIAIKR